jgi:hypothetical protein
MINPRIYLEIKAMHEQTHFQPEDEIKTTGKK